MKALKAKDVMNPDVLSVEPDLSVHELSVFLIENQISGAPVVDHRGLPVGLVSLTDIVENDTVRDVASDTEAPHRRRGASEDLGGLRVRSSGQQVRDIMTPTVFAVDKDTPVTELAKTMVAGRIHRLLVTDGGQLVGIVSSLDLLPLLVEGAPPPARRSPRRVRGAVVLGLVGLGAWGCNGGARVARDAAPAVAEAGVATPVPSLPPGHPVAGDETGSLPPGHPALPAGHPATAPGHALPSSGNSAVETVRGTITLAPSVRDGAPKGAALFLIARGGKDRQIVAVRKVEAVTFPYEFELSSGDAMSQGTAFGGPLEITARLSRSGDAAPGPGDIEGRTAGVAAGATNVRVQLDQVRP